MTTIETQIPESLYSQVKLLAERESMTVDHFVAIALAAQVSAWLTKRLHSGTRPSRQLG